MNFLIEIPDPHSLRELVKGNSQSLWNLGSGVLSGQGRGWSEQSSDQPPTGVLGEILTNFANAEEFFENF